jgi:glycosyltransferase involved in cell wall biosynthesis
MNKLKICVYAICNGERHFIPRWIESAMPADYIVICDTGSKDGAGELAKTLGATVYNISVNPWRFDIARNTAVSLLPEDADVCISLDIDEILQPGWREEIERVWIKGETNRLKYMFDWGAGIPFYYEKIHARHGFVWKNIIHEVVAADPRTVEKWATTNFLLAIHRPDPSKPRSQYMPMLEADVKDNPYNPRNSFYFARELTFHSRWEECIREVERYLKLDNTWKSERMYALRIQGQAYSELKQFDLALQSYLKSVEEWPLSREPWIDLATHYLMHSNFQLCLEAAEKAIAITDRENTYTVDPGVWGGKAWDMAAWCAWNLGIFDKAYEYGSKAAELDPAVERYNFNLQFYKSKVQQ